MFSYTLCNLPLVHSNTAVNDLGIIMDRALHFHEHVEKSCCIALKTLGFMKRIFTEFKLLAQLKAIYCTIVRSILEYASVIWDPYTATSKKQIERVQRKFLNYAARVLHIDHRPHDYEPVSTFLGLSNLTDRLIGANQTFLRKLIDGSIDYPELLSQINFKNPSFNSRSNYPFSIPILMTNYMKNKPMLRMMLIANEFSAASSY